MFARRVLEHDLGAISSETSDSLKQLLRRIAS